MIYHRARGGLGMAGKYFEELKVGDTFRHEVGRTITEADNVFFSTLTMNPQPLHIDFHAAAKAEFGKPLVNSLLTLGIAVGISVGETTLGTTVGNLGFEKIEFPKPVFHGDTIYAETEVVDTRESKSRPQWGIVTFEHRARNQHGDLVMRARRNAMTRKRNPSSRTSHAPGSAPGPTRLVLIATETPQGLLNIREVAAASPRVVVVSWGIEDLSAAMGLPRVRDTEGRYLDIPRYARTMCAIVASAAGVDALDTVYTDIADLDGLRRECEDGVAMGFSGKISIHPSQIEVINAAFTPAKAVVEEARELVAAFEEHRRRGVYAFRFKGQMVDAPHLTRALKIIARS